MSTIQGNFLSAEVQAEVIRFLRDPESLDSAPEFLSTASLEEVKDNVVAENVIIKRTTRRKRKEEGKEKMVDVVLSDMSAPWEQTTGFWKRSLSDPYIRMMNTSGISFKDHAGSMVVPPLPSPPPFFYPKHFSHVPISSFRWKYSRETNLIFKIRISVQQPSNSHTKSSSQEAISFVNSTKELKINSSKCSWNRCLGLYIGRSLSLLEV